jgi:hypothetical protein
VWGGRPTRVRPNLKPIRPKFVHPANMQGSG